MESYITEEVFRNTMEYYTTEINKLEDEIKKLNTLLTTKVEKFELEGTRVGIDYRIIELEMLHKEELDLQYTVAVLSNAGDLIY